jgi:hypothetical protein
MSELCTHPDQVELRELRDEALANGELIGEIRYRTEPARVALVHPNEAPTAEVTSVGSRVVRDAPASRPARSKTGQRKRRVKPTTRKEQS